MQKNNVVNATIFIIAITGVKVYLKRRDSAGTESERYIKTKKILLHNGSMILSKS